MQTKTPTVTIGSTGITIVIVQNTVSVELAYDITITKPNHSDTIRMLSKDDLSILLSAVESLLTILP